MNLSTRLRTFVSRARYLRRTLALIWEAAGGYTLAWAGLLVVQGVAPVLLVHFTRLTVDELVAFLAAPGGSLAPVVIFGGLLATTYLVRYYTANLITWVNTIQALLLRDHASRILHRKARSLDLAFFDESENYDRLHRAKNSIRSRPQQLLQSAGTLIQGAITLVGMLALLFTYTVWLPFALLLIATPSLIVVLRYAYKFNRWRISATPRERESLYYEQLLTLRETASEVRIFDLSGYFMARYDDLREGLRDEQIRLERNRTLATLGAMTLSLLGTAVVMAWMGWQVLLGNQTLGQLAAFYQIFNQSQSVTRGLLRSIASIYESSLFIEDMFEFLDRPTQPPPTHAREMIPLPLTDSIRFENVTFCYPGTDKPVLENFDWEIPAGRWVALVGENGEGKSTLIKLLSRLYEPQAGRILWDGVDIRDLPREAVHSAVTILFQAPIPYNETAHTNIALGSITTPPTRARVAEAAAMAGIHDKIVTLADGYDTRLGRIFGGAELSGGQWQRLALARALVRQAGLVILDEPTSAMDSWAELDWLERMRQIDDDHTLIIITHRFTTAMQADVISLIEGGQITEQGSHTELMALDGRYAASWKGQTRNA